MFKNAYILANIVKNIVRIIFLTNKSVSRTKRTIDLLILSMLQNVLIPYMLFSTFCFKRYFKSSFCVTNITLDMHLSFLILLFCDWHFKGLLILYLIKNMLKRRKESNTYLATFHEHCWSSQITMRKDNYFELSASTLCYREG